MNPMHTEEYKGYTIQLYPDPSPEDPRSFESNLGRMVCFHGRHNLGDKHTLNREDFSGWKALEAHLRKELGAVVVRPLFLYDHSGLRMKIGGFQGLLPQGHAEFDSGQVGFIYATPDSIRKWYDLGGRCKLSAVDLKKAAESLEVEVKVYDRFLSGDVYGYTVTTPKKCKACGHEEDKEHDSCWGFYGTEETLKAATQAVDGLVAAKKKGAKR